MAPTPRRDAGAAAGLLTRLLRLRRPAPREAQGRAAPERVRSILIIKSHDQLGDFLLATPTIAALRERYPLARMTLITRTFLAPLARRVPGVDRVWVLPRLRKLRHLARWVSLSFAVVRMRPDLAFVLNSVSRSKSADCMAALSGARLVVGRSRVAAGPVPAEAPADPFEAAQSRRDPVYELDLDVGRDSSHQVDRLLDLVRWTGATPKSRRMTLAPREDERQRAGAALTAAFAPAPRPARVIGLHPGAANHLKCWPLESFADLGAALVGDGGDQSPGLAVFDSPTERGRAAAVCAGLESRGVRGGFLAAGGIDWFAALCSHLDLLVCNDSGVMHVAAALGVPTVSFHSLGDPREWAPEGAAVAFHAPGGIGAIPVVGALAAVKGLLELRQRGAL